MIVRTLLQVWGQCLFREKSNYMAGQISKGKTKPRCRIQTVEMIKIIENMDE